MNAMIAAGKEPKIEDFLELVEVTTFDVQSSAGTAISMGVKRGVIQPWYFGPYSINVVGKSYIGAYADNRINYGRDENAGRLIEYTQMIKDSFLNGDSSILGNPSGIRVILSCIDPATPSFFGISSQYEGFIDDIKYTESEDLPYMLTYNVKFVGELYQSLNANKGKTAAATNKRGTPKLRVTYMTNSELTGDAAEGIPEDLTDVPPPRPNA